MRCIKMRGKKGSKHNDPNDPPKRRGNKKRGHGSWDTDRVPVIGIVGRESSKIRLWVVHHATREEIEPKVLEAIESEATVNTDDWRAYAHLEENGHTHSVVNHSAGEWARDDDGDGIREVHVNTLEGLWTGLRNFLRIFRGVSKVYLHQYIKIFEWANNFKRVTKAFLRKVFTRRPVLGT